MRPVASCRLHADRDDHRDGNHLDSDFDRGTAVSKIAAPNQGKPAQAHKLLALIHGSFTEGFEMRDVREACDLLGELG